MVFLVDKKKTISSWKIRAFMFLLSESHHHASSWIYVYYIHYKIICKTPQNPKIHPNIIPIFQSKWMLPTDVEDILIVKYK